MPTLGFDATFAIGNYRGMGKFVRQLVAAYPGPSIAFTPASVLSDDYPTPWPLIAEGNGPEPLWEQLILPKLAARANIDLLLCGFNTSPVFKTCPPTILVLHDLIFRNSIFPLRQFQSHRQLFGAIYRRLVVPSALARASSILTVSETSKLEICSTYDLPLDLVSVVPNTLSEFWFQEASISYHELSANRPYILAVSGAAPSKNLHRLINAFANAQQLDTIKGFDLMVVGLAQSEHARFNQLATECGVGNRVVLCPRFSDLELKSIYINASIFIFPSTSEGFGIPLLEAMAVGTPVICSSIPVFREIGLGYVDYFDPLSVDDIEKSLVSGLSRGIDSIAIKAATDHARTYSFNIKQMEITKLFKKIISEHL